MPLGIFVPAALNDLAVDVAVGTPAQGAVLYKGSSKWNSLPAGTNGQVLTSAGAAANPSWTTLPTDTDTLATLTDVSLSGTAQGQILYRGAAAWNNLGVGTSGQYLQTQGAAANPVWATLPATLSGDVILAPASSSRNVVQPTGAAIIPLIVRGAASQSANLTQWQGSNANIYASMLLNPGILRLGDITGGGAGAGGIEIYGDNGSSSCSLKNDSALGSAYTRFVSTQALGFDCPGLTFFSPQLWKVYGGGNPFTLQGYSNFGTDTAVGTGGGGLVLTDLYTSLTFMDMDIGLGQVRLSALTATPHLFIIKGFASQAGTLTQWQDSSANILGQIDGVGSWLHRPRNAGTTTSTTALTLGHASSGTPAAGFGSELHYTLQSSTTADRDAAGLVVTWATATDASRAARAVLNVYDTSVREALRVEASGSAALIGFLGAAAVVRQTLGNAATDAATTQTLANNLRTALINLGLGQT